MTLSDWRMKASRLARIVTARSCSFAACQSSIDNRQSSIEIGRTITTLIKNGTIITATETYKADILVKNGQVSEIGREISKIASEIIDAADKWVLPGAVDVHT